MRRLWLALVVICCAPDASALCDSITDGTYNLTAERYGHTGQCDWVPLYVRPTVEFKHGQIQSPIPGVECKFTSDGCATLATCVGYGAKATLKYSGSGSDLEHEGKGSIVITPIGGGDIGGCTSISYNLWYWRK